MQREQTKSIKMGASGNADSAKIASLQERKKHIQDRLEKHHKELRKLCIDEAELTGQLPVEYPFEPGELPPTFRRRVGTSYQLNKNLLNNLDNEGEISVLEMEMHMLANMAQAALGLANESTSNKAGKKAHLQEYETHMAKHKALENKLHDLKISASQTFNQQKHKKKPRPEKEHGDSVSMNLNMSSDPFAKPFRHSLRSLQYQSTHSMHAHSTTSSHSSQSGHAGHVKQRPASQRYGYLVPDGSEAPQHVQQQPHRDLSVNMSYPAVKVEPTLYKLSLDGYKQYEDKQETLDVAVSEGHFRSYPGISRTLPHASRRSPQTHSYTQGYTHTAIRSTLNHSPGASTSVSASLSSMKYYPVAHQQLQHAQHMSHPRQYYDSRVPPSNPLQLQPHQQYENVMTSGAGLGGYWKQSENGEFWCNNSSTESMKDKRFGSLDRRKNKRLQKKAAVSLDQKSATLTPSVPSYQEATRTLPTKSQAIAARRHETRQLVRTQSLGSVGVGLLDTNCPSDDSSCGSENINSDTLRKNKQKEWYETSLDGPPCPLAVTPTPSLPPMRTRTHSHSHSIAPSIAPEEKYLDYPQSPTTPAPITHHFQHAQHSPLLPPLRIHSPQMSTANHHSPQLHSPSTPKEIPAESNPSPRVQLENREIFNNNMPKNCTVVQQAQWKPYHEETKPFEMADFYKYSTKYKKKPEDSPSAPSPSSSTGSNRQSVGSTGSGFRNLPNMTSSRTPDVNVNTLVANTSNVNNISNVSTLSNSSFDNNPLSPHVADNFSAEMNAWYQKHEHQSDNNNATLV